MSNIGEYRDFDGIPSDDIFDEFAEQGANPLQPLYEAIVSGLIHRFNRDPRNVAAYNADMNRISADKVPRIETLHPSRAQSSRMRVKELHYPFRRHGVEIGRAVLYNPSFYLMAGAKVVIPGEPVQDSESIPTDDVFRFLQSDYVKSPRQATNTVPDTDHTSANIVMVETKERGTEGKYYYHGLIGVGIAYADHLPVGNRRKLQSLLDVIQSAD